MFFRLQLTDDFSYSSIKKQPIDSIQQVQAIHPALLIVTQGAIRLEEKDSTLTVAANSWYFLSEQQTYHLVKIDEQAIVYILFLHSDCMIEQSRTPFLNKQNDYQVILARTGRIQDIDQMNFFLHQFEVASAEYNAFQKKLIKHHLISNFCLFLANQFFHFLSGENYRQFPAKFEWIIDWITSNCEKELTVTTVAQQFDITPAYLTTLFNKYYGCSTIKFIHQVKISKAKDLLLTTNLSVKQIALYLNFQNVKYFMRLFKNETNHTPTEYRNSFFQELTTQSNPTYSS
ncbi:MAG: helix-turn-helix domain-containing protein [Enterococcus sp.]